MSFQAYLDTVKTKTGKTPGDFAELATQRGLSKHGEIVAWLKSDFDLGHGHANAVTAAILKGEGRKASPEERVAKLFAGNKRTWRDTYDQLVGYVMDFGADVSVSANETYVNVLAGKKKFAILQPASHEHFDVGLKLGDVAPSKRLEPAGSWNNMVSHRVRLGEPNESDEELRGWLRQAYENVRS
jgi:hypothetical protein